MFFQLDLYPVSAHSSGSLMSTRTNPRSRWSFTSLTLIFSTAAEMTRARPAARTTVRVRARTARGATAAVKVREAVEAAMLAG